MCGSLGGSWKTFSFLKQVPSLSVSNFDCLEDRHVTWAAALCNPETRNSAEPTFLKTEIRKEMEPGFQEHHGVGNGIELAFSL